MEKKSFATNLDSVENAEWTPHPFLIWRGCFFLPDQNAVIRKNKRFSNWAICPQIKVEERPITPEDSLSKNQNSQIRTELKFHSGYSLKVRLYSASDKWKMTPDNP